MFYGYLAREISSPADLPFTGRRETRFRQTDSGDVRVLRRTGETGTRSFGKQRYRRWHYVNDVGLPVPRKTLLLNNNASGARRPTPVRTIIIIIYYSK